MPQRKSTPSASAAAGRAPAADLGGVREILARGVVLTTERLQDEIDDVVRRGRMTRADAEELVESLVSAGRRQADELLADVEALLGRPRAATGPARRKLAREADRARCATGPGSPAAISGYDELTAAQVTERLDELSDAELREIRDYERRHGNRKSVIAAVERRAR